MKTQFDWTKRVVSRANLEAMCSHVSGTCHRYWIEKETKNRIQVGYSNPNEYGAEFPMYAELPTYNPGLDQAAVVLDILRVTRDTWDGEGWQAFQILLDCPTLWRSPVDGSWRSETDISATA